MTTRYCSVVLVRVTSECYLWNVVVIDTGVQIREGELRRVPYFVAEEPVALHAKNIEIYVATLHRVGAESESQSVRATFGDSLG